jgi:hypothetical protein
MFRGVFSKLQKSKIYYGYWFIFLKKNLGLVWVVQTKIYGSNLIKTKSYFCSNLDHPSKIQRPRTAFSIRPASARTKSPDRHGHRWRRSSSTRYGAWGKTELVPTRSRRATGLVLLTFSEENDPRRASGCGLKSLVFDSGAWPRLSFSGFKTQLQSFTLVQLLRTAVNHARVVANIVC